MVRLTLAVSLLTAASAAAAAAAASRPSIKPTKARVPGAFIFELDSDQDATDFYDQIEGQGETRMKLDYKLFRGISVQLNNVEEADARAARIASLPVVRNMWPVEVYSVPDTTFQPISASGGSTGASSLLRRRKDNDTAEVFSTHVMTQVDRLRAKGITGKGIKIAVMDTGIDYTHPALGGCFGPGCHVAFGTDLVGDDYDGFNTPVPDADPMDGCYGHGTHVAGIIAARENEFGFTGAAPDATLGAYRVFGCAGEASNDVLIAAYNQAFEDGAAIITASIAIASGWTEEPWSVAVSRIVEQGVPCTVSAGNRGLTGMFYSSTAANGKKVTAVASFDNTVSPSVLVASEYSVDGGSSEEFGYSPSAPSDWANVTLPLWAPSFDTSVEDGGCDPYPADTPDLSGFIVLVRRGTCPYTQKAQNAVDAGAKYLLVYSNRPGTTPFVVSTVKGILAAGMVTPEVGIEWISHLEAGSEVLVTMSSLEDASYIYSESKNTVTGGALSTSTSWGPTYEMDVKPQVGSPGANILSLYPVAMGSYAVLSGTSMSCPLVAAAIALIAQVRGTFDPELIETLLSNTANPQLFNDGAEFYDFLAPVPQQGGGLIQAYDAAYTTTLLEPPSLSFNDTDNFIKALNFTLSNKGDDEVTYDISNIPTVSFYTLDASGSIYPLAFPNEIADARAELSFSEAKVTLGAGEKATVEVLPTPPARLDGKRLGLWSGYVAVNGSDGTSLSIPYQGLTGSLRKARVLGAEDDTWITRSDDDLNYDPVRANQSFTLPAAGEAAGEGIVFPTLLVNLALGSPRVTADIVPLGSSGAANSIGQIQGAPFSYLPRGFNPFDWNGKLDNGQYAPAGRYKIVVRALHIFGDDSKEEDWDVGETGPFSITYKGR